MKLEPSDWRRLWLLSAFYGCDWQGAPGAQSTAFFRSSRRARAGGAAVSPARARRLRLALGNAAGSLEPAASFVRRLVCAGGGHRTECGRCGDFSFLPKLLKQWDCKESMD